MKTNSFIRKIVYTSLFAALTLVATITVQIPISATNGYINIGDCVVIINGILLGPLYGGIASGLGSFFADALYGYWIYAPATFIIKMLMSVAVYYIYKSLSKSDNSYKIIHLTICGIISETTMILGYFIYEFVIFSFSAAIVGVVSNMIQGIANLVLSLVIIKFMHKTKIAEMINI